MKKRSGKMKTSTKVLIGVGALAAVVAAVFAVRSMTHRVGVLPRVEQCPKGQYWSVRRGGCVAVAR